MTHRLQQKPFHCWLVSRQQINQSNVSWFKRKCTDSSLKSSLLFPSLFVHLSSIHVQDVSIGRIGREREREGRKHQWNNHRSENHVQLQLAMENPLFDWERESYRESVSVRGREGWAKAGRKGGRETELSVRYSRWEAWKWEGEDAENGQQRGMQEMHSALSPSRFHSVTPVPSISMWQGRVQQTDMQ